MTINSEKIKLNTAIKNRWSPRKFTNEPVTDEMLDLLFEAARRAPSSRNEQPWQYFYAKKQDETAFSQLFDCLTEGNKVWAKSAQVLMVSVMKKNFEYQNRPNGKALHDVGAANVSLAIQAAEMGLQAHQMGGFDKKKAAEMLQPDPEKFEPVTMIAVGFPADESEFTEDDEKRMEQHNSRKETTDFAFSLEGQKRLI
jgi:nitroreductase